MSQKRLATSGLNCTTVSNTRYIHFYYSTCIVVLGVVFSSEPMLLRLYMSVTVFHHLLFLSSPGSITAGTCMFLLGQVLMNVEADFCRRSNYFFLIIITIFFIYTQDLKINTTTVNWTNPDIFFFFKSQFYWRQRPLDIQGHEMPPPLFFSLFFLFAPCLFFFFFFPFPLQESLCSRKQL